LPNGRGHGAGSAVEKAPPRVARDRARPRRLRMIPRPFHLRLVALALAVAAGPGRAGAQVASAPVPPGSVPLPAPVAAPVVAAPAGLEVVAPGVVYEEQSWLERHNPFRSVDPSKPVTVDELCRRLDQVAEK